MYVAADNVVFYHRFCFGAGAEVRAALVCTTKQRSFNAAGQLTQVRRAAVRFPWAVLWLPKKNEPVCYGPSTPRES